jgi:hypothetical protein
MHSLKHFFIVFFHLDMYTMASNNQSESTGKTITTTTTTSSNSSTTSTTATSKTTTIDSLVVGMQDLKLQPQQPSPPDTAAEGQRKHELVQTIFASTQMRNQMQVTFDIMINRTGMGDFYKFINFNEFYQLVLAPLDALFTIEELLQIQSFYQSSAGQKYIMHLPKLLKDTIIVAETWIMEQYQKYLVHSIKCDDEDPIGIACFESASPACQDN